MNETGLIVAEVVFLVLLYAFVWTVVRSSSRQLRMAQPPQAPPEPAPPAAPVVAAAVAPPPPAIETPQDTEEPLVPARGAGRDFSDDRTEGVSADDELDFSTNLDPRLIVESSDTLEVGRTIALEGGITVGRSEAADLSIPDHFVSHMHCRILRRGAYHFIEDLGSTNGTFLNDRRVDADAQLRAGQVDAHLVGLLGDIDGVGGRADQHGDAEILDEHDLPSRIAGRHRQHGGAEVLGGLVPAEPAGEQAVAHGDLHEVVRHDAGGGQVARADLAPDVHIGVGVGHHRRLARGSAGGMNAAQALARHGQQPEGIVIAKVGLGGEGESAEVLQGADLLGQDAAVAEHLPVKGHRLVHVGQLAA